MYGNDAEIGRVEVDWNKTYAIDCTLVIPNKTELFVKNSAFFGIFLRKSSLKSKSGFLIKIRLQSLRGETIEAF